MYKIEIYISSRKDPLCRGSIVNAKVKKNHNYKTNQTQWSGLVSEQPIEIVQDSTSKKDTDNTTQEEMLINRQTKFRLTTWELLKDSRKISDFTGFHTDSQNIMSCSSDYTILNVFLPFIYLMSFPHCIIPLLSCHCIGNILMQINNIHDNHERNQKLNNERVNKKTITQDDALRITYKLPKWKMLETWLQHCNKLHINWNPCSPKFHHTAFPIVPSVCFLGHLKIASHDN